MTSIAPVVMGREVVLAIALCYSLVCRLFIESVRCCLGPQSMSTYFTTYSTVR